MTRPPVRRDEGGEAPCFAHLLDESSEIPDALLADRTDAPRLPPADPTEATDPTPDRRPTHRR